MSDTARVFGVVEDPDVAPVAARSPLDEIREELAAEVATEALTLEVKSRPGYAVRYEAAVSYDQVAAWRKKAKDKSLPGGINELRFAAIVLANTAAAILRGGAEIERDGERLTFASAAFHELVGAHGAVDAVRRFYSRDAHVTAAAGRVLEAAGFGDDVDEAEPDPTER